MEIIKLKPVTKDYIWGGTRLRDEFGLECDSERCAEGWMLSCHPDGRCTADGGRYDGQTLAEILSAHPSLMGKHAKNFNRFPLLIKLIDARDDLSVQVHPDDEYALAAEDSQGKTELWYIIDAEPGAQLIYGFSQELTQEQFYNAIMDGSLLDKVNYCPVKAGDVFYIEAGTLHAIGKGILLAEVQQNSNATYRVYDYNRLGADGNPRPLHIDRAIDVAITVPPHIPPGPKTPLEDVDTREESVLGECRYFKTVLVKTDIPTHMNINDDSFVSVLMISGKAGFFDEDGEGITLHKGDSAFIPAGFGELTVSGEAEFIWTTI